MFLDTWWTHGALRSPTGPWPLRTAAPSALQLRGSAHRMCSRFRCEPRWRCARRAAHPQTGRCPGAWPCCHATGPVPCSPSTQHIHLPLSAHTPHAPPLGLPVMHGTRQGVSSKTPSESAISSCCGCGHLCCFKLDSRCHRKARLPRLTAFWVALQTSIQCTACVHTSFVDGV